MTACGRILDDSQGPWWFCGSRIGAKAGCADLVAGQTATAVQVPNSRCVQSAVVLPHVADGSRGQVMIAQNSAQIALDQGDLCVRHDIAQAGPVPLVGDCRRPGTDWVDRAKDPGQLLASGIAIRASESRHG